MAEILFDKFADRQALEAEKAYILGIFGEIKSGIKDLSTIGTKIESSTSVRSINSSYQEYDRIVKTVSQRVAELNGHSKELTQQILLEARAARELSAAKLNDEKASLAAAKAKQAEAAALKTLNAEQEKAGKAGSDSGYAAQVLANSKAFQAEADAKVASTEAGDAYAKSLEYQRQQQEELNAAMESAARSGNQPSTLVGDASETKAATEAVVQYATASEQITGTLEQNQKLQATYQQELAATAAQIKFLEKNTTDAEKSTQAYQDKVSGLRQQQTAIKTEMSNVNKITALQTIANNAQTGSLEQLRAKLQLATIAYNQLSEAERASMQGQAIKAEVTALSTQVSTLEQGIGQFQRNVGNYGSAVTKFFGDAWTAIRKVAYILPGIGIAGIFSFAIDGITQLVEKLGIFNKAVDETKEKQDILNKAYADKSVETAIANVKQLTEDISLAKQGFLNKTSVLNEYNKVLGESTGKATSLDEAEKLLVKNGQAFVQMTIYKTAATLAYQEASQKAIERQLEVNKTIGSTDFITTPNEDYEKSLKDNKKYQDLRSKADEAWRKQNLDELHKYQAQIAEIEKQTQESTIRPDLQKQQDDLTKVGDTFREMYAKLSKEIKIDPLGNFDDNKGKSLQDLQKFLDEANKAQFDSYKIAQQQKIENDKVIADDDKQSHEQRFQALLQFLNDSKDLADAQAQFDIENAKKVADQRIKEAGGNKDAIKAINLAKNSEIERIEAQHQETLNKIIIDANKTKAEILKEDGTAQVGLMKSVAEGIEKSVSQTVSDANKRIGDESKQLKDKAKEIADYVAQLAKEITNFAFTLGDGQIQKQRDAIQEQIDLLDQKTQKEIDGINATTMSEQDKAAKIAIIEARANAQKTQYAEQQRRLDRQKAVADKEKSIVDIVESTAVAIMKSVPDKLFLLPYIIGLGAAQLATAIAQPIPQYRTGTKSAKPGLAMVSEEGREMIIDRQGRVSLTPDQPSLIQLSGGETIIPHDPTEQMIARSHEQRSKIFSRSFKVQDNGFKDLAGMVMEQTKVLRKIEAKPATKIIINNDAGFAAYIKKSTQS